MTKNFLTASAMDLSFQNYKQIKILRTYQDILATDKSNEKSYMYLAKLNKLRNKYFTYHELMVVIKMPK